MIKHLYIRNFTLIDELSISFHPGFSVITGETGAGKSIILGAIGLLLGQRADSKLIKSGKEKCTIEAHFDISRYNMGDFFETNDIDFDAGDTILRRELTAAGKSRAFINDTPVSLQLMRDLGEQLVDVHSQHQNLLLNKEDFQLSVVDIIADDNDEQNAYQTAYREYKQTMARLEQLRNDIAESRRNEDFLRFQWNELNEARLQSPDEQEELEQLSETLSHAEEIKSALYEADNQLNGETGGIVQQLRQTTGVLRGIANVFPAIGEATERLESAYIELKDIAAEISADMDDVEFDPARLDDINNRLDLIYSLQHKHHVNNISELLELQEQMALQLSKIDNGDAEVIEMEQQLEALMQKAQSLAKKLTSKRQKAAKNIEQEMKQRLVPLGIANVRFQVSIEPKTLSHDGADKVAFLFSANSSSPLQPVSQVASGGEISRVMLSLKAMISGAVKLPTIIFDEIDTGVSGKTAEKMAHIMQEMGSQNRQVISITHLPQIAACGSSHYRVQKEETAQGTRSTMTELTPDERIKEIAQMLSGADVSEAAMQNARELLRINHHES